MMVEPEPRGRRASKAAAPKAAAPATNGSRPRTAAGRSGVIGIPGDRRDDDQREYGAIAATRLRRDHRPRGQEPARPGARRVGRQRRRRASRPPGPAGRGAHGRAEKILDEMTAVRPPSAGRRPATWSCCASTTPSASTARRWRRRAARRADRVRRPGRARGAGGLSSERLVETRTARRRRRRRADSPDRALLAGLSLSRVAGAPGAAAPASSARCDVDRPGRRARRAARRPRRVPRGTSGR